jgi:hypothetical protein
MESDRSLPGLMKPQQGPDKGRFAVAVRTHEEPELAKPDLETEVPKDLTVSITETDAIHIDQRNIVNGRHERHPAAARI